MGLPQPAFEALLRELNSRTGMTFPPWRHASVETAARRAMRRANLTDLGRYLGMIAADSEALDDLVAEVTVGETYFFREPAQVELIQNELLPEIRARRGEGHIVRAWSAGCASGEEAYSLAMVFAGHGIPGQILATDVSKSALAKARRATYGRWSLRGEGAANALPYLRQTEGRFEVDSRVRRFVTFEYLNLALDEYPSVATMDVILCRNVLIYFDLEVVGRVARRLHESLAPGGWLITASSDPSLSNEADFEPVMTSAGLVYRRRGALTVPPARHGSGGDSLGLTSSPSLIPSPPQIQESPNSLQCQSPPSPPEEPHTEGDAPLSPLAHALEAYARGDYAVAADLAQGVTGLPACALRVRALANVDGAQAERDCAEAVAEYPLSTELHHLHALLLLDQARNDDAARAARRVIYLDPSLAVGHFTLATILHEQGDVTAAHRAYRNARDLCLRRPADEPLPLSDGEPAGRLAAVAASRLSLLAARGGDV